MPMPTPGSTSLVILAGLSSVLFYQQAGKGSVKKAEETEAQLQGPHEELQQSGSNYSAKLEELKDQSVIMEAVEAQNAQLSSRVVETLKEPETEHVEANELKDQALRMQAFETQNAHLSSRVAETVKDPETKQLEANELKDQSATMAAVDKQNADLASRTAETSTEPETKQVRQQQRKQLQWPAVGIAMAETSLGDSLQMRHPTEVWRDHPSLAAVSLCVLLLSAVAVLHSEFAPGCSRRLRLALGSCFGTSILSNLCLDWLQWNTSWQAPGVLMITPHLDLHAVLLQSCLLYCSYAAASRLFCSVVRAPWAEAGLAGLLGVLFQLPHSICSAALLWTTWHHDDASVRGRVLGVPYGTLCWTMCYSGCFTRVFRMAEVCKWGAWTSVLAACCSWSLISVMLIIAQVFSGDIFRAWPGESKGSPERATLGLLLAVHALPVYRCLRREGYISRGLTDLMVFFWDKLYPPDEKELRRRRRRRHQPIQDETEGVEAGSIVVANMPLRSRYGKNVSSGTRGTVTSIYPRDGDALIAFEGCDKFVLQSSDFGRLTVEKRVCPRCSGRRGGCLWSCRFCRGEGMLDLQRPLGREPVLFLLGILAYFVFLATLVSQADPELQFSTGLHQGWGSCDSVDRDLMRRPRRPFTCPEHYERAYFSLDCKGGIPPDDGSQWYTICGLPRDAPQRFAQYSGIVSAVVGTSLCGALAYLCVLAAHRPRKRDPT